MLNQHTPRHIAILLLTTVQFLESTMIAFASSPIRGEIQASPEQYSFVAALYACIAVVAIANVRWFSERMGWRNYVLISIALYIIGCAICSASGDLWMFLLGRVVMALGGSAFMTIGRIIVNVSPGPMRISSLSYFATGVALGMASAPWIAAMAVTQDHWQAIFWILMGGAFIIGLLMLGYAPKNPLPKDQWASTSSIFVLFLALTSFFVLYLMQRSYYDFYTDGLNLIFFLVFAMGALFALFYVEHQRKRPLLKLKQFISRRYIAGISLFCACYFLTGANNYIQPEFLSKGLGYAWESIGKFQALAMMSTLVTWVVMRITLQKYPSPIKYWIFGFASLAAYGWIMSSFSPEADMWGSIVPAIAFSGCFMIAGMTTTAMQTFSDVAGNDTLFTHAYQFKNMLAQIVQAMGTAVATVFLQWRQTVQYNNINNSFVFGDPSFMQNMQTLSLYFSRSHESTVAENMAFAVLSNSLDKQAMLLAGIEYFWVVFWVGLAMMAFTLLQRIFR